MTGTRSLRRLLPILMIPALAFFIAACDAVDEVAVSDAQPSGAFLDGNTIHNLTGELADGREFKGRITNIRLTGYENGVVTATGRVIGQINNQRVDEPVKFDIRGSVDRNNGEVRILRLELGSLFLDLLGLIIEIPGEVIAEIRADSAGGIIGRFLADTLG